MNSAQWADWNAVFQDALRPDLDVDHRSSLLAAICIAALKMCGESLNKDRKGGFPRGRPDKNTTRAAAVLLVRESSGLPAAAGANGFRTLGLLLSLHQPQATESTDRDDERLAALAGIQHACEQVDPTDRLLLALSLYLLAGRYEAVSDRENAIIEYDKALNVLDSIDMTSEAHWLYDVAPFLSASAQPGFAHRIALRAHLARVARLLDLGRVQQAMGAAEALVHFTSVRKLTNPGDHGWALGRRSRVERENRDVQAFLSTEQELKELAESLPEGSGQGQALIYWWGAASNNAQKLKDFSRSSEFLRRRISYRARRDLGIDVVPADLGADDMRTIVAGYHSSGSDGLLTNIGNDVYDLALNLYSSGVLHTDKECRADALELLDVVEEAWKNFAVNGLFAVALSRARISLLDAVGADVQKATDVFLHVNEQAIRFNTKRRALVAAVRFGTAGSAAVLERLHTLIGAVDPAHAGTESAHLHGMLAEFWLRSCRQDEESGSAPRWEDAESAALTAAPLLRPNGVSLDPELEAVVWQAAAAAIPDRERSDEKLTRLLRSIECIAELIVTISTTADRRTIAVQFASVFEDAIELSLTLDDHAAADLIMEATRRDRVGLLLAELVSNPTVANTIRAAALAVADSSGRILDVALDDEGQGEEDGGFTVGALQDRSAAILHDRAWATQEAERILGPLGASCDPKILSTMTARRILRRRAIDEPTAVLQVLPLAGVPENATTSNRVTVYRRLTYTTGSRVHEYLDRVVVPEKMLTGSPGDAALFVHAARYAEALIPTPLRTLLDTATRDTPIRLLVVPTGFFHIPFDYLPVPGGRLLDKAIISLHGSLTSINSLLDVERTASTVPSIAVYDDVKLGHAEDEYLALVQHLSDVRRVASKFELDEVLLQTEPPRTALLAMGVHGTMDEQGWGQAKIMPDGSRVTAADVLRWDVPRLVVLASCHSSLTTVDGIELGGFPLALMLRGATTVVGGIFQIPDEPTTAIMKHFWANLGEGQDAVRALRSAKLDWLSQKGARTPPRAWTGLITYGAASG